MALRNSRHVISFITSYSRTASGLQGPPELSCSSDACLRTSSLCYQSEQSSLLLSAAATDSVTRASAWRHLLNRSFTRGLGTAAPQHNEDPKTSVLQPQRPQGWLFGQLPPSLVPYAQLMRLDKPAGTWVLLWPGLWSIALAAPAGHLPDLRLLTLFSIGAVLLRGAGCTVNDVWDRDLDARVERTRSRPLASGVLQPIHALGLLAGQLCLGLMILLQLNQYSQVLGATSLLFVGTYPLMKRITYWPQAFLGLTINWGALLGWAAARGECDWSVVLPLFVAGVSWTLLYDTIYAHQDKRDDVKVGVRSTALLFGDRSKLWLSGFGAAHVACLAATGSAVGAGPLYHAGVLAAAAHLAWQTGTVNLDDPADCMRKFVSNSQYGGILFGAIVADRLFAQA